MPPRHGVVPCDILSRAVLFAEAGNELHTQPAEDVIHQARRKPHVGVRRDPHRFKALVGELVDEAGQRDAVLERDAGGGADAVHQSADGRAFLRHGDEELAGGAVLVQADGQIAFVTADIEAVGDAVAGIGKPTAHGAIDDPLDDALDHLHLGSARRLSRRSSRRGSPLRGLGGREGASKCRDLGHHFPPQGLGFDGVLGFDLVQLGDLGIGLGVERLAQLAAVAVEGIGLQAELPTEHVGLSDLVDRRLVRKVDGLRDGAGDERLGRSHHANVPGGLDEADAERSALVGAVEDREVLRLQTGGTLDGLGSADDAVERRDLRGGEPHRTKPVEAGVRSSLGDVETECADGRLGHRPTGEGEPQLEELRQLVLEGHDLLASEALRKQELAKGSATTRGGQ